MPRPDPTVQAEHESVAEPEPEATPGEDPRLTAELEYEEWLSQPERPADAGSGPEAAQVLDDDEIPTGVIPVVDDEWTPEAELRAEAAVHAEYDAEDADWLDERYTPAGDGDGPSEGPAWVDEAPTTSIPVLRAEPSDRPDGAVSTESTGTGPGRLVVPASSSGMSIPGLGLVGADGPRIEPVPGSIEEAMRAEVERPRPRPQESESLKALHAWCRARTAIVPSGFTIQVQVLDPAAPSYRFDLEPPDVDDPEFAADKLSGLLGDLWLTEAESEQGGWLFARVDAAGRTLRIDRWYDQVPDWWDNPVEPRLDVHGLVRRLNGRGPEWQPSYLERLYTTAR